MADSMAAHPILAVGTYREGFAPAWENRSFHQRLVLDPFSKEETAQMVAELAAGLPVAPAARELVIRRAEGNPLFIDELTGYLQARELLSGGGADRLAGAGVPAAIQDLRTARIDRLPELAKRVLQMAAVLGREFSLSLLEAVSAGDVDVNRELAVLVRAELLAETAFLPEQRYRFAHLL